MKIVLCLLLFITISAEIEIPWNSEKSQIEAKQTPQAIAVDANNIYILANFEKRVLVFDKKGNYIRDIKYHAEGCGLAVDNNGTLAVYSPISKTITWINGERKNQTIEAPQNFTSISEMWHHNNAWWIRNGWKIHNIAGNETNNTAVFTIDQNSVALRVQSQGDSTITMNSSIVNAFSMGAWHNRNGKACIIVSDSEKKQVMICDASGNYSEPISLMYSVTDIFQPYTIGSNGDFYEMVTTENGITIYQHNLETRSIGKLATKSEFPQDLQDFLLNHQGQTITNNSRAMPTYINVFFRSEGRVRKVSLQSYLKNCVSAEIYGSWTLESHKAMAVASRTYAVARTRHPETSPVAMVCTSTHCQAWKAETTWKADQAVDATNGVGIYHNGSLIREALYFAHCNGYTRNSEEKWNYIPYLRSKKCACGKSKFYGHGVGACQWGLQKYSLQGWSYSKILEHYYTGTIVK